MGTCMDHVCGRLDLDLVFVQAVLRCTLIASYSDTP